MEQGKIEVKNLDVRLNSHHILKNINFNIPPRKITAIIGPSGCGKTTLLKSFNRLITLQEKVSITGAIMVDGENIMSPEIDPTMIRKKMGLLLQRPYPLPMSIFENVAYGPRIHGLWNKNEYRSKVEYYLRETSLWEEVQHNLHQPASQLSVGQQQRLCLARGLAVEPEIILGDEPTSALDPISSQRIETKFKELKERYTIIMVTHILRQAKRLADYVVFMYMGEVIEHGPAERIFEQPEQELTREYIKGIIS